MTEDIYNQLVREAYRICMLPDIDLTRLAFLVSPEEWEECEAYMRKLRYMTEDNPLPLTGMTILGIELRKRY